MMHKFLHLMLASTTLAMMGPVETPHSVGDVSDVQVVLSHKSEPCLLVDAPHADVPMAELAQVPDGPVEPSSPAVAEPPSVKVKGPRRGFVDEDLIFQAKLGKGIVQRIRWRISPEVSGMEIDLNGQVATFRATRSGSYRMVVAVSGPDGLDVNEFEFEVFDEAIEADEPSPTDDSADVEPPPQPDAPDTDVADNPAPQPMPPAPMPPAVDPLAELVVQLVSKVPSRNRINEARVVADAYVRAAALIENGNLPVGSGANPFFEAQQMAAGKLAGAARQWVPFFPVSRAT